MPVLGGGAPHLTGRVLAAITLRGLLSTGLAYVLNFRLIAELGATTASSVNYVVPVAAVLLGVVFLGEHVTWNLVAGGAIVMAGMWVASSASRVRPTTCAAVPVPE